MNKSKDYLDEAKKIVKILNYIQGNTKTIGRRILIDPCPMCNHKGHFYIYPSSNTFSSESKCCRGGSIVDYLIQVEGYEAKTAIVFVLNKAGFKEINKKSAFEISTLRKKRNIELTRRNKNYKQFNNIYNTILESFKQLNNINNRNSYQNFVLNYLNEITEKTIEYNDENFKILKNIKKDFWNRLNNDLKMYELHKEKNNLGGTKNEL